MVTTLKPDHVRTRFCIISDTHSQLPLPSTSSDYAYRQPLPSADVLLHAGDITTFGYLAEYEQMMKALVAADAELKIVIAGNHDITLHDRYYRRDGHYMFHRGKLEDLGAIRELWLGEAVRKAGIVYLEEGTRTFELSNGAKFTVSKAFLKFYICMQYRKSLILLLTQHRSTHRHGSQSSAIGRLITAVMKTASIQTHQTTVWIQASMTIDLRQLIMSLHGPQLIS